MTFDPLRVFGSASAPLARRAALAAARPLLRWGLAFDTYDALFERVKTAPGGSFASRALHTLGIDVEVMGDPAAIPASGPVVVVANHPHGIVDGLVLTHVAQRTRRDVRVVTNHLLAGIPELGDMCLFVDAMTRTGAAARTRRGLRAALDWLRDGHALIVFPAGEVAHTSMADGSYADSPWRDTATRLATHVSAQLVPMHIAGSNSPLFYRAGTVHPLLRTLLLPRELLRQRGTTVRVSVGPPAIATPSTAVDLTGTLRQVVDQLRNEPSRAAVLEREVLALPPEQQLLHNGRLDVFCAPARLIPNVLHEIGRLREVTFRAVGEGTGNDVDLDRFDGHYLHLFAWHRERREVVGAYRVGETDTILGSHGVDGLYTSTLFRYDERLLARIGPALELGRSFVRAEYQRSPDALLLLWKGIARLVARSNRYRALFGPVSISRRYADTSQRLLRAFLAQNARHAELAELVESLNPPAEGPLPVGVDPSTIDTVQDLDRAIARLEGDGTGIPVLLRQYLRLHARLLGFNVDPDFGHALDALMVVDLAEVDPSMLRKYFGAEAAALQARLHATASQAA